MSGGIIIHNPRPATLANLKAETAGFAASVYLEGRDRPGDGGEGIFVWEPSDHRAHVSADPSAGIYVPPNSDPTGASGCWLRAEARRGEYQPEWFGTINGAADDATGAIQAAIDTAYEVHGVRAVVRLSQTMYRAGSLKLKCRLDGPGTLKAKDNPANTTDFIQVPAGFAGVIIRNVTLDGNLKGTGATYGDYTGTIGLQVYADDVTVENVSIQNTVGAGIHGAAIARVTILGNRIKTARGQFGDGIYLAGAVDCVITGNHIEDFTRIGIVSEKNDSTLSARNIIVGNEIYNGHDASILTGGTESNAGIWIENSLSALVQANSVRRMTHYGIVAAPHAGMAQDCSFDLIGNHIRDCAHGIRLAGASQNSNYNVIGGSIQGFSTSGVAIASAGGIVNIRDVTFGTAHSLPASGGLVLVDVASAAHPIKELSVSGCTKNANTYATDAADLNVYSAGSNLQTVLLTDLIDDWAITMRQAARTLCIANCRIFRHTTNYDALNAPTIRAHNTKLFAPPGLGQNLIPIYNGSGVSDIEFDSCSFDSMMLQPPRTNMAHIFVMRGCRANATQVQIQAGIARFDGNYITDPPTDGFVRAGYYNQPYALEFIHNRLTGTSGNPLVKKWNFDATRLVLIGNDVDPAFATASGMSVTVFDSPKKRRTATTSPVIVDLSDYAVMTNLSVAGPAIVHLPANPENGRTVVIADAKGDASRNNITITPASGTINGTARYVINTDYGAVRLVSNGTNWFIE